MYSLVLYGLAFLLSVSHALPVVLEERDVYNPRITSPDGQTVWLVGSKQTVTWDTSDMPPDEQVTNPIGKIVLGWQEPDSMNLQIDSPLAEGFNVRDGQAVITVPNVPPRDNYIVVVFGDSGNSSPEFRIEGPLITDPIPISGTTITGSLPEETHTLVSVAGTNPGVPSPDPSTPSDPTDSDTSQGSGTAEGASSPEETDSSGWSIHANYAKHTILGIVSFSLALML